MSGPDIRFADLSRLVLPQSIVLVGASEKPGSIGQRTLENLMVHSGWQGRLSLVNPARQSIAGRPCAPSVRDLDQPHDVAILAVRAELVLDTLRQCGECGTRYAIVFSSGFGETGDAGRALEAEMRKIVADTGMRIYGPNSPGLTNVNGRLGMSFSPAFRTDQRPGPIGVASQGGGLGRSFIQAMDRGVGTGLWFSGGNEADLEVSDYIHYMADAPDIEVIVSVLEGVRDGPRFMAAALHAARRGKPIVALKVGKSDYGIKATQSHTAAISGSAEINSAVFKEVGVIEVDDVDQLIDTASMLVRGKPTGRERIAVYCFSGGTAALASDQIGLGGLVMSEFTPQTLQTLRTMLPDYAAIDNPVDVTAEVLVDPTLTYSALKATAEDPNTDLVVVPIPVEYGQTTTLLGESMARVQREVKTPIVPIWMSDRTGEGHRHMIEGGLMPMRSVRNAVKAMRRYIDYGNWRAAFDAAWNPLGRSRPAAATATLSEVDAKALLGRAGLPVPRGEVARTPDEAARAFEVLRCDGVVMKVISSTITHKTDVGGVQLGVRSPDAARAAHTRICEQVAQAHPEHANQGVLVEAMLPGRFVEVVVGIHRDPVFGHVCTFGLGGVSIELFKDVSRRLLPLTPQAARAMIAETRCSQLLNGYRGQEPYDVDALVEALVKMSDFVAGHADRIEELEINPLAVRPRGQGVMALDAVLSFDATEKKTW
ncbi:ATP-grasp domain protein 2 [Achromobacter xylosoxidans A8]|uniref:ATP-grasp domain protein 2 n=1 Tax=Achromobacter xylosoxidans (strain A8) TaxID=762376 RepID=E3HMM1_ACHXA|nr:acetate--CoA ligase family protein [Achromobacter xylosoxidans]ADP18248.1 ATP-grasp domain protein 2 [Achromobacter xylosoxidans A8]